MKDVYPATLLPENSYCWTKRLEYCISRLEPSEQIDEIALRAQEHGKKKVIERVFYKVL